MNVEPEKTIVVATRGSALALRQAEEVVGRCRERFPNLKFEIRIVKTHGDRLQRSALSAVALPKGLFTKELEVQLLRHKAHFAVHSLKDVPVELPSGLTLAAIPQRADPRDVLICRSDLQFARGESGPDIGNSSCLALLPNGAIIGTSSLRRRWQLLARRSDLRVVPLRGNVETRLQKLAIGRDLHGIILAKAGLDRLGFEVGPDGTFWLWQKQGQNGVEGAARVLLPDYRAWVLDVRELVPCAGQGALAIETREDDERTISIVKPLDHYLTRLSVEAEREFLRAVGGGCRSPVAVYVEALLSHANIFVAAWTGKGLFVHQCKVSLNEAKEASRKLGLEVKAQLKI